MQLSPTVLPFTGPMPTASQPAAKRRKLDDNQVQTQGRQYVLMVCVVFVELAFVVYFTVYKFRSTVNWEIFVGSDVLRKYFSTKILQHRSREERTERVTAMEKFFVTNCIRGYHVYKKVWAATVGEAFVCKREPQNSSDRYSVAVKNEGTIIEHLPRKLSRVC